MKRFFLAVLCFTFMCGWVHAVHADTILASGSINVAIGGEGTDILLFPGNLGISIPDDPADESIVVKIPISPTLQSLLTRLLYFEPKQLEGVDGFGGFYYYTVPAYSTDSVPLEFNAVFSNATATWIDVAKPLAGINGRRTVTLSGIEYVKYRNTPFIPVPYAQ
jgi:hypothetical protein